MVMDTSGTVTLKATTLDLDRAFLNDQGERYEIELRSDATIAEDGIVLVANRAACLAFAKIFAQLAQGNIDEGHIVRLGFDEADAVGLRIILDESGRLDGHDGEEDDDVLTE